MHQLFVVTQCRFTLLGIEVLMNELQAPARVIQVGTPEDVFSTTGEDGNRAILVIMPEQEPAIRANGMLFLWRWALSRPSPLYLRTPCLLLCDRHRGGVIGSFPISLHLPPTRLSALLSDVLSRPEHYYQNIRPRPLSALQKTILKATIEGETVQTTAARLGLDVRSVFACRAALIHKLGLRNRMELMCLTRWDVL